MYLFACVLFLILERVKDLTEILHSFDKGKLHGRHFVLSGLTMSKSIHMQSSKEINHKTAILRKTGIIVIVGHLKLPDVAVDALQVLSLSLCLLPFFFFFLHPQHVFVVKKCTFQLNNTSNILGTKIPVPIFKTISV